MDARKAHKASSSSSPSSSSKRWEYQVFLSFRGEDTRKGFTGHLHAALSGDGFRAFLDDNELKRAEFIKTQLEQAIDGSMISIIVFSKRYADSSWCLDELVKIMECRERLGQQVIPLFYNVEASDVRKQTGSFAQAFEKHEAGICEGKHEKEKVEKEKVQRWRNALTQAADLCGEDLKNADGHEAEFINKILGVVNKLLDIKSQLDIKHPVGITSRVKALSNHLHIENSGSKDDVRMIGIWGMGGIGKTTLAKAIYNKFGPIFEGRSFLADVREVFANQRSNGLVGLQEQLLNDILKSKDPIKVDSVDVGITVIQERLHCKRALVIIDDADDLQQLEAIAGARDWFGPGSRILITTRNQHLLQQVGVDGTYIAEKMDEEEALEFFSWQAFKRRYPEYLDLSKRVIRYCQGLPLALRVVGSFLFNRSIAEWESHLEKLQTSPDGGIQKILRISFDGLPDDKTRKIFLDISCFFIGDNKDYVTKILDGCGFFATIGISVLIERCLVTLNKYNELGMHDLLRDMGRKIVYENARGHPEKFSRLWKHEDVTDVLRDKSGTKKIEGVALHGSYGTRFSAQAFTNMKKLRLLHLNNVGLTGEYKDFPKKLIWLCWHGFPLESIPDDFPMQPKLVALDLQRSKLKIVWKDCKLHQNLKILNLSYSYELTKSPDFSKLPNLEELILQYCESLSEVHSSIGDLGSLSLVNLEGCKMLRDLPLNFYKSKSIKTLLLDGCRSFKKLAEGLGDMESLTTLKADETAIRQIPSSILKLKKLKDLSLWKVKGSPSTNLLPPSLQSLSSLRELTLAHCHLTDDAFPKDLGSLISLEYLDLEENDFCSLPSLSRLSQLQVLSLKECGYLRAIPDLPTNLKVLGAEFCPALEKMPDFSEMSNIKELYLSGSDELTEIPGLDKSLNSMTMISMDGCTNLTADFRKNILQGWTSCGYGGIFLSGNDIPDWFDYVRDEDIVCFTVPRSVGRNLKGLTLAFVCSSSVFSHRISFSIKNMTKGAELEARIILDCPIEGYYLWQGQLSNDELKLQDGDKVLIEIIPEYKVKVKVKKTGVSLVWDKIMNENMIDYHLCRYERRPSQNLVNDDDIIHVEDDNHITKSPDFSKFPNLEKLTLKGCKKLIKVHSYIGDLGRLSLVDLEGCTDLEDLPLNFYKSKSIETLILNGCSRFHNLADGLGDMVSLTTLEADETAIRQIPSLAALSKLKVLCLNACRELLAIPDLPTNLYVLKANGCPKLETIPDFSKMLNMRDLQYSELEIVWKDCKLDQNLKILNLSNSYELTKSPDFSKLPNLEKLILKGCEHLDRIHSSIGHLERLSLVNLEDCINLEGLPLNFYKSKSIETLILNGCSRFQNLADGLGDMVSLTILEADKTAIRQIPSSIVKLKKLRILSLSGCSLSLDAIRKDLGSLISLEDLLLEDNDFCSLPSLAGLSNLKVLCVNACKNLRAIPDLPTNLYVLKANVCPKLETIPDFSKMLNMRELYLNDSVKLTEVPGLDKSLNSMTRIHMEGCTNLTADFRNSILQRWTSCGFGGIYLNGIYDIPEWFKIVNDVDNIVSFEVPQRIMGRDLKGLTICFVYSCFHFGPKLEDSEGPIGIIVRNLTKQTTLHANIAFARYGRPEPHSFLSNEPEYDSSEPKDDSSEPEDDSSEPEEPEDDSSEPEEPEDDSSELEDDSIEPEDDSSEPEEPKDNYLSPGQLSNESKDHYLWQGQLSNDVLCLQAGDQVSILVRPLVDFVIVKKTGVHLEWDKLMKENMDNLDPHLYDLETNLDFLGGIDDEARPTHDASAPGDQVSAIDEESAVEDDPLGHGDLCTRLSLSIMENLDFSGGADDGAGRSHGAFVRTNQSGAVDKQLEWDKVMKENMDNSDPHLYDLETNRDFLSLSIMENLDFSGGAD